MRALLDTHTFLWWLLNDPKLSRTAHDIIADTDTDVLVSAVSAWEIATKHRIGKLPDAAVIAVDFEGFVAREEFTLVSITPAHALYAGALPGAHRDPFDRMLAAQAQIEGVPIISGDRVFDGFGVRRLW